MSFGQPPYIPNDKLTCGFLPHPLCRKGKNFEDLSHYLHNQLLHRICRWNSTVNFKPSEEALYSREYVDERIVACTNISGRLIYPDFRKVRMNGETC
jgi:hypothetical protein